MPDDAFVGIVAGLSQFANQCERDGAVGMTFHEFRYIEHTFALFVGQSGFSRYEPAVSGLQNARTRRVDEAVMRQSGA